MNDAYDRHPGFAVPLAHPDRLAAVGWLYGVDAALPERCRILELGCGAGGHLLPLAAALPHAELVGVDLSRVRVRAGQDVAASLGLDNVRLLEGDLRELGCELGAFDYVVAHGVYSWVGPDAQGALLRVCAERLAPGGLAYVSFDALPAWRVRGAYRDALRYHVRGFGDLETRIAQARAMSGFLVSAAPAERSEWGAFVQREHQQLREASDAELLHGLLADEHRPVFLRDFVAHASASGLRYVADARVPVVTSALVPPGLRDRLQAWAGDRVALEQYVDFAVERGSRAAILCREEQPVHHDARARVRQLRASTALRSEAPGRYAHPDGRVFTEEDPATRAVLDLLVQASPTDLGFEALLAEGADPDALASVLLTELGLGRVELCRRERPVAGEAPERPRAPRYARSQAAAGVATVPNLLHRVVSCDPLQRQVLALLDGTRDREAILTELLAATRRGDLTVSDPQGQPLTDPDAIQAAIAQALDPALASLAALALIEAP